MRESKVIPVTVLTGFLGAGKTTLLGHLLTQEHGYRCAVIINELGEVGIDHQWVLKADEEIVELSNGCLCCRVRGDLIESLKRLLRNPKKLDCILIETTGLADPAPIAATLDLEDFEGRLRLDAVVTVVDARHVERELEQAPETAAQIGFADVILLNKTDLCALEDLETIERRLRRMNPLATFHRTVRSVIGAGALLNRGLREVSVPLDPAVVAEGAHETCAHTHDHDHSEEGCCDARHASGTHVEGRHDDAVRSFVLREERPLDQPKTERWLSEMLGDMASGIYRCKGFLYLRGQAKRVLFQAVQMMCEATPDRLWLPGEKQESVLVFIGRDLDEGRLRAGFADCLAGEAPGRPATVGRSGAP